MDVRDLLPAFLAEAREHLQQLGLALVRIEAAPADRAAAEELFRAAHTLKGMSATMGCSGIAELTHAMEDVLELLRQRAGGLPPAALDVLSACLDALEEAVESLAAGGGEQLDAAPLIARLRALARERTPAQELARDGDARLPDLTGADGDGTAGERLLHVVAELDAGCAMPGVRAHLLFEAVAQHGELAGGVPAPEAVERFTGRRVEAWVATRADEEALAASARAVGEVASVAVRVERRPAQSSHTTEKSRQLGVAAASAAPAGRGATVRVDAGRLDELLHLMGELVQQRTALEALAASDEAAATLPALAPAVQRLARTSQALRETVVRVRMVPVESVFLRFPRLVRDLATRLGKQVELQLEGAGVELDRTVVDALADPLVHLVRNALDHGLEAPEERVAAGKPPTGRLVLSARHAGAHVVVAVRDDGRGIAPAAVARAAVERGLLSEQAAASLDAAGAAALLFEPGFSTAPATTDLSGRGVGMDAVRERVRALGGEVRLTTGSDQPAGTCAELRLPLTLASIHALLVEVDGLPYALPLEHVVRTVRLAAHPVRTVRGVPLLALGGELLPLLDGAAALRAPHPDRPAGERAYAVVASAGACRVALAVDALAGQRELVTRPLPRASAHDVPFAAGAVLPDGAVALVVDCAALHRDASPAATPAREPVPVRAPAPLPATEGVPA